MSSDILFDRAIKLHQEGRLEEAEVHYRKILEITPDNPDALHLIGLLAHQKGVPEAAIEYIYKAIDKAEKNGYVPANFYYSIAAALQDTGRLEEAIDNYQACIEKSPDVSDVYNNLGNAYRGLGKLEKAIEAFEKAVELAPDNPLVLNNMGLVLADIKNTEKAKDFYKKAIGYAPDFADPHYNLANLYRNSGQIEPALKEYKKAIEIEPENPSIFNSMGIAFEKDGDYDKAFECYQKAISLDEYFADALCNSGNILIRQDKLEKAEKDLRKAVKIDKDFADAHSSLGTVLMKLEKTEEALDEYRKAFVINPKHAETCNNLGKAVQEAGDDEEALGLYFNALELDRNLKDTHYNIYNALYSMFSKGRVEQSTKIARNWLKNFPENPLAEHIVASFDKQKQDRASDEYLRQMFDAFSEEFDTKLERIEYRFPEILKNVLSPITDKQLDILDAGCGTGLCADVLKPLSKNLVGLDISEGMLEKAKEKNIYDKLVAEELTRHLLDNEEQYDMIVAADVLCYFGRLDSILNAMETALKPKGKAVISLEKLGIQTADFQIKPTGRYQHSFEYFKTALEEHTDMALSFSNFETLRKEKNKPVEGVIAVLEKH